MYSSLVEMIMNSTPYKNILDFIREELLMLIKGHVPLKDLVITKTLGKGYSSTSTHLFVYSNRLKDLGIEVKPTDRLDFVFAKTKKEFNLQGHKMCPPELIIPHGLTIDYLYYIENHISNPIDQILKLLEQKEFVKEFAGATKGLMMVGINSF